MTAYYGFKVKGNICEFLENFEDFYHIPDTTSTGFLGVPIEQLATITHFVFINLLHDYHIIASRSKLNSKTKEGLQNLLQQYADIAKKPIVWHKDNGNHYYDSLEEFSKRKSHMSM